MTRAMVSPLGRARLGLEPTDGDAAMDDDEDEDEEDDEGGDDGGDGDGGGAHVGLGPRVGVSARGGDGESRDVSSARA